MAYTHAHLNPYPNMYTHIHTYTHTPKWREKTLYINDINSFGKKGVQESGMKSCTKQVQPRISQNRHKNSY